MNPKLQKLRAELDKNTEKISKLQFRNALCGKVCCLGAHFGAMEINDF